MATLYPYAGRPRTIRGAPKVIRHRAALYAAYTPEVQAGLRAVAESVGEIARGRLAERKGSQHWSGSGISNLRVEVKKGNGTDWHVNLAADGRSGMSEDDVVAALFSLENGRRSYKNKKGQKIPALQGMRVLGGF